jgi:N-succinyldiaminopimelate aminotransferase
LLPAGEGRLNPIYTALPTTIFEEMSGLARDTGAINLGQGFPDGPGPTDVLAAAADATLHGSNQYPPMRGTSSLRHAVADHYRRFQGLTLTGEDVLITSGATEALASTLLALISPGDEVLLIQPLYDAYLPLVQRAGGTARFATMQPPDWGLPLAEIAAALKAGVRLLVLNNPVNPTGRVFDEAELGELARLCFVHDAIAICDEVWEHVVFGDQPHIPLIGLAGMAERTVKIGSAGKIFGLTGWKVGFVVAAPGLLAGIAGAHLFLTFTTAPNLQEAVAYGLGKDPGWFDEMRADYRQSRARLAAGLTDAGYAVLPGTGTYFLCVDLRASGIGLDDRDFSLRMVREAGVASIPLSSFYAAEPLRSVIRLCFAKQPDVLDEAVRRMAAFRETLIARP